MADTPPVATASASSPATGTSTVTDHRPVPRGVLPRGVQTWVMAGLAVGMLAIMLIVGRPDPPARPAASAAPAQAPNADRVRDYQDRLRAMEAQAMRDAQAAALAPGAAPVSYQEPQSPPPQDPIVADRKRREYREPLRQQRRPQSPTGRRAPGRGSIDYGEPSAVPFRPGKSVDR